MRKLLLALPLVAGASWAGTTYVSSSQTQPAYDKLLSQLNQLEPLQFVSENYDKGFMQSTAITKVMWVGETESEPLFRLKHVIDHSPVGVDNAGTRIGANSVVTTFVIDDMNPDIAAALAGQEPATLHTRVELSGDTVNELELAQFSVVDNEKNIEFGGGNFQFVSDPDGRVRAQGSTRNFHMSHIDGSEITIAESPLNMDIQYISDGLYSGNVNWDIAGITASNPAMGMNISFQDISIASTTELNNEFMNSGFSLNVGHLDAPIPVNSLNWSFFLAGLPLDGIVEYQKMSRELMSQTMGGDSYDQDQIHNVLEAYKAMVAPGLSAKNTLKVSNEGGDIGTEINVSFRGDGSESGFEYINTVRDLLSALQIGATVEADVNAVNMTPLAMFAYSPPASNFLINDGVTFSADLSFQDLILYANGETHDVIEQFGLAPMLDAPLNSGRL